MSTTQQTGFVDPSSLSLPSSSSLKRSVSPASSRDDSPVPQALDEPPRKRPRSAVTPEERKEARAHRNRIAAQNSRDRRKAQFSFLERRVAELEEENRRLRTGIPASPTSTISEPEIVVMETDETFKQRSENERRERENEELRERIRTLEKGYEAVVRALASQGTAGTSTVSSSSGIPTSPVSSSPASPTSSPQSSIPAESAPISVSPSGVLAHSSYPLSPAPTNSTLSDSPSMFANDSFDFPQSPSFSLDSIIDLTTASDLATSSSINDLSLSQSQAPTRHLARVATTAAKAVVALQRVGNARLATSQMSLATKCAVMNRTTLRTRQPQTLPSRACSQRSSRRRRLALALFQALALRQKTRTRRC
ncbi:hypothetical protein BJ138DRAFT_1126746 [Hygrophoropsis aurantiaca]|uniref:Uncharacterized protein n=1 Tax=Hygrophoropsis aurantiaca TaxID=72124 RepID=A0ACB8ABW9_9AGAM|nr:hypothetical protein BJ138DRAFT_1126746 [Hygrophoropsis aurantiaca]